MSSPSPRDPCDTGAWPAEFSSSKFPFTRYCIDTALDRAVRQRFAALNMASYQPAGSFCWGLWDSEEGEETDVSTISDFAWYLLQKFTIRAITRVEDRGGGRVRLYDEGIYAIEDDTLPGHPITVWSAKWVDGNNVKRWVSFAGTWHGIDMTETIPDVPGNYQICLFPLDPGTPPATQLADPAQGLVYVIRDCGLVSGGGGGARGSWVEIDLDGRMSLNPRDRALDSYVGFGYVIQGQGTGSRRRCAWFERYPPEPNYPELDWGLIEPQTLATTTSITDLRPSADANYACPKNFPASVIGKEAVFQVQAVGTTPAIWKRTPVLSLTSASGSTLNNQFTFAAQPTAPAGEYWFVEPGKLFRPDDLAGPLRLARQNGRKGKTWKRAGAPWLAGGLAYSGPTQGYYSHNPDDDSINTTAPVAIESMDLSLRGGGTICDATTVHVFDQDAIIPFDECVGSADRVLSPWLYHSLRGRQLWVEILKGAGPWVEKKEYEGAKAIPLLSAPRWWQIAVPSSSQRATITALKDADPTYHTSSTVYLSALALPIATPQQGAYATLPVVLAIYDADGNLEGEDQGYVSGGAGGAGGATLTALNHVFVDDGGNTEVGRTIIFSFVGDVGDGFADVGAWRRRYARLVKYLYPRSRFEPEDADHTNPTEDFPGSWRRDAPSTNYAEFTKYGKLQETGHAFLAGELAVLTTDNFTDPTTDYTTFSGLIAWEDVTYQNAPMPGTSFPRWESDQRGGAVREAGSFYIQDPTKLWWCSASPLRTESFTADGSSTSGRIDYAAGASSGWWNSDSGQRWIRQVAECETDPAGKPDVYERRPITAQTSTSITVDPPFSVSTAGKKVRIREPGKAAGGGAILNLWEDAKLTITRAADGAKAWAWITRSDDDHLYFAAGSFPWPIQPGDAYVIERLDPYELIRANRSAVVKYAPGDQDATKSGWVGFLPHGTPPTVVHAFGRYRRRDYLGTHLNQDMEAAVNVLIWLLFEGAWDSKGTLNYNAGDYDYAWEDWNPPSPPNDPDPVHGSESGAESDWDRGMSTPPWNREQRDGEAPRSLAKLDAVWETGSFPTDTDALLRARLRGLGAWLRVDGLTMQLNHAVDFFAYGEVRKEDQSDDVFIMSGEYPDPGDYTFSGGLAFATVAFDSSGLLLFRRWHKWSSAPADASAQVFSPDSLGTVAPTRPAWPASLDLPAQNGPTHMTEKGWYARKRCAIVKFDVAGGLTYR